MYVFSKTEIVKIFFKLTKDDDFMRNMFRVFIFFIVISNIFIAHAGNGTKDNQKNTEQVPILIETRQTQDDIEKEQCLKVLKLTQERSLDYFVEQDAIRCKGCNFSVNLKQLLNGCSSYKSMDDFLLGEEFPLCLDFNHYMYCKIGGMHCGDFLFYMEKKLLNYVSCDTYSLDDKTVAKIGFYAAIYKKIFAVNTDETSSHITEEEKRKESFEKEDCPKSCRDKARLFAEAGFSYIGHGRIKSHCCGISLHFSRLTGNPLISHLQLSINNDSFNYPITKSKKGCFFPYIAVFNKMHVIKNKCQQPIYILQELILKMINLQHTETEQSMTTEDLALIAEAHNLTNKITKKRCVNYGQSPTLDDLNISTLSPGFTYVLKSATPVNDERDSTITIAINHQDSPARNTLAEEAAIILKFETTAEFDKRILDQANRAIEDEANNPTGTVTTKKQDDVTFDYLPVADDFNITSPEGFTYTFKSATCVNNQRESTVIITINKIYPLGTTPNDKAFAISNFGIMDSNQIKLRLLEKEHTCLKDKLFCAICKIAEVSCMFLPCGHIVTCEKCIDKTTMTHCCVCKKPILSSIKVYLPM